MVTQLLLKKQMHPKIDQKEMPETEVVSEVVFRVEAIPEVDSNGGLTAVAVAAVDISAEMTTAAVAADFSAETTTVAVAQEVSETVTMMAETAGKI